jgi:hypothetical protein
MPTSDLELPKYIQPRGNLLGDQETSLYLSSNRRRGIYNSS